jgi:hypothetical protein
LLLISKKREQYTSMMELVLRVVLEVENGDLPYQGLRIWFLAARSPCSSFFEEFLVALISDRDRRRAAQGVKDETHQGLDDDGNMVDGILQTSRENEGKSSHVDLVLHLL